MLYLIGLGLNKKGISLEGLEIVKRCKKVYLENYTVDFPYSLGELSEVLGKDIVSLDRGEVEGLDFIDYAKRSDVALLIYGSPLMATTHVAILDECSKSGIKTKVLHSGSVFDAISETGLQAYKFGKVASMPAWDEKKNFVPDSFMEIVKDNQRAKAHSLILIDIGLDIQDAFEQLEKSADKYEIKLGKLIVCQSLGTKKQKIFYKDFEILKEEFNSVRKPYCLIIPSKDLHHVERDYLRRFE
jgi:diphthine synthase